MAPGTSSSGIWEGGRLCSPGPCHLACRSKYFPYLIPVLSSCRTVCRMSLIRIGCRLSSSLCGALVPPSSGPTWLVGPVPAILFWGDCLRIDLKHDRGMSSCCLGYSLCLSYSYSHSIEFDSEYYSPQQCKHKTYSYR